jgi:hypothetical protein
MDKINQLLPSLLRSQALRLSIAIINPSNEAYSTILSIVFAADYRPETPLLPRVRVNRIAPHTLPNAPFLLSIGYPQYLESLKASEKRLRGLVTLPSKSFSETRTGRRKHVEKGLLVFHNAMRPYLKDANLFVTRDNPLIRMALVHG